MVAICHADKLGYLKNNEKAQLIFSFTEYHKNMHRTKFTFKERQQKVLSDIKGLFPNCVP